MAHADGAAQLVYLWSMASSAGTRSRSPGHTRAKTSSQLTSLAHLADQQRNDNTDRTNDQRRVDALGDLCAAYDRGEVTGGRNLPRVIATLTLTDLEQRAGVAHGTFGENITSAEIDQICCDAVMHRSVADQTGATLNFGRGRRTISPQQVLALIARDGGCRHPGCDRPPHWCEGHHINEFSAHGGNTDLDELVLVCHHHHHDLHDRSWQLTGTPQHLTFTGPDGRTLHSSLIAPGRKAA
jgi:5-methylcytosine-specific restriction protein A